MPPAIRSPRRTNKRRLPAIRSRSSWARSTTDERRTTRDHRTIGGAPVSLPRTHGRDRRPLGVHAAGLAAALDAPRIGHPDHGLHGESLIVRPGRGVGSAGRPGVGARYGWRAADEP